MRVTAVESTELFVGTPERPLQVVAMRHRAPSGSFGPRHRRGARRRRDGRHRRRKRHRARRDTRDRRRRAHHGHRDRRRRERARHRRVHGRRARLDHVHGQPLPLRPRLVEHPGRLHRDLGRRRRPRLHRPARPPLRLPRRLRDEPGAGAQRSGPARPGVHLRARRGRLPQALLGRLPGGARLPARADPHRPRRDHGRHLQRAEHQSHRRRGDRTQCAVRRRIPARDPRGVPGDGLATGRVRARPAVPGADGGRGGDIQFVGARAAPPVGADDVRVRGGAARSRADAVPGRVRVDRPLGARAADRVHGQPLRHAAGRSTARPPCPRRRPPPSSCSRGSRRSPSPATCCSPSAGTTRRRAAG